MVAKSQRIIPLIIPDRPRLSDQRARLGRRVRRAWADKAERWCGRYPLPLSHTISTSGGVFVQQGDGRRRVRMGCPAWWLGLVGGRHSGGGGWQVGWSAAHSQPAPRLGAPARLGNSYHGLNFNRSRSAMYVGNRTHQSTKSSIVSINNLSTLHWSNLPSVHNPKLVFEASARFWRKICHPPGGSRLARPWPGVGWGQVSRRVWVGRLKPNIAFYAGGARELHRRGSH